MTVHHRCQPCNHRELGTVFGLEVRQRLSAEATMNSLQAFNKLAHRLDRNRHTAVTVWRLLVNIKQLSVESELTECSTHAASNSNKNDKHVALKF